MPQVTTHFDLDDTLTPTQQFYEEAKTRYAEGTIASTGADMTVDEVVSLIDDEVDSALYDQHGVTADRFRNALYAVSGIMLERTGTDADDYDFDLPEECGTYPVDGYTPSEMLPGAAHALAYANDHGRTTVLTKGVPAAQEPKLDALGLAEQVDETHIVDDKADWFADNLADDPEQVYIKVGNSVKSDIVPALDAHEQLDDATIIGIHVPAETWAGEHTETTLSDDYADAPWMRIESLEEFGAVFDAATRYAEEGDRDALERFR